MCHPSVYKYDYGTLYNEEKPFGKSLSEKQTVGKALARNSCKYVGFLYVSSGCHSVIVRSVYATLPFLLGREYARVPHTVGQESPK